MFGTIIGILLFLAALGVFGKDAEDFAWWVITLLLIASLVLLALTIIYVVFNAITGAIGTTALVIALV